MQHRDPSSDDNSLIQPADFSFGRDSTGNDATSTAAAKKSTAPKGNGQLRAGLIGGALLLGLVAVFWLLPQMVKKPKPVTPVPIAAQPQDAAPTKQAASPYTDAQIAQQRREVQEILQEILMLQDELEERRVEIWANNDFSAARALSEEADGIYRQRKFKQALDKYRASLAAFQQLRDSIPERIEKHLAEGNEALDHGEVGAANKAFDLVLVISDNHPRGIKGKKRAEKLPEAWKYFTGGKEAFAVKDLNTARDQLQQSLAVDPETRPAKALLPKVLAAITERDYSEAMSAGYAAIAREDFTAAVTAFKRAQSLKPKAKDPAIGLQQASNGAEQLRIDRLFARAQTQEGSEDWHSAVASYEKLLKTDGSLVSAITGKARAQARAKLDDQLQDLLKDPLTLGGSKRNAYARGVLADARKIGNSTESSRLEKQIDDLETALTQALIPVPVLLQSDSSTNVTIYHVGRLGNFAEREVPLKPGRYTAVGTRTGYRDVRREFIVVPGEEPPTVVIECAERIISANNS
ncbi:tetratricopeptide repeat protein [Microbulbifer hainanensis]|uniref:hypothetical protein n=1 Tax=Microbulbifer hainanensis TaxID=2735675 RepID=UPI001868BAFD|nr:hypothetical protein [Microbulbifer hainanensis]